MACMANLNHYDLLDEDDQIRTEEGAVSEYGKVNKHEDWADTVAELLNPNYTKKANTLDGYQPNLIYDSSNPRPLHKKLVKDVLFGRLPSYQKKLLAEHGYQS